MAKFDHEDCIDVVDVKDCSYTQMGNVGVDKSTTERVEKLVQETLKNITLSRENILKLNAIEAA